MTRIYLTHATLALPEQTLHDAGLVIEGAVIAEVCPQRVGRVDHELDVAGDVVMPGLIDLHSDAIELDLTPRPGVEFPIDLTIHTADRRSGAMGITTVFHALAFAGRELGLRNDLAAARLARRLADAVPRGVDHRVHARLELTNTAGVAVIQSLIAEGVCSLVSIMDHSPGQGQFPNEQGYRDYLQRRHATTATEVTSLLADKRQNADARGAAAEAVSRLTESAGLPLAVHDVESPEDVSWLAHLGASVCEFPLSIETCRAARSAGLHTVVGAPNVIRGGSSGSGPIAAEAIEAGADCLCSDYSPSALLPAVFELQRELDWPLHRAVALATQNPASAAGLSDRGELVAGHRADLLVVEPANPPWLRALCAAGRWSSFEAGPRPRPYKLIDI